MTSVFWPEINDFLRIDSLPCSMEFGRLGASRSINDESAQVSTKHFFPSLMECGSLIAFRSTKSENTQASTKEETSNAISTKNSRLELPL